MEEAQNHEPENCGSCEREQFFNEEFGYTLITSVVICTFAIINVVSLIA